MDCRILRQLMLKADGNLVCDDSNGYFISLGEVSTAKGWNISQVLSGGVYAHVRRSFQNGVVPWPSICETCDLFSRNGIPNDTLNSRLRLMVEPTLACKLACPTCKRVQEANRRRGNWDLDPLLFASLLQSCARQKIAIEEIQYLGWGEPLLHPMFDYLSHVAREYASAAIQEVTTTGNVEFHKGLRSASLDKVVISCDGIRQDKYERFRRRGQLPTVFKFMQEAKKGFKAAPFMEWKYIVFEHNDSDEELLEVQKLAEEFGVDSILFILTNSKNASRRFHTNNLDEFPIRSQIASVMPAAAMMKTKWTGKIISDKSSLGDRAGASLYLDRCTITESNIMILEGWCLGSNLRYVGHIDVFIAGQIKSRTRTLHPRIDVLEARPGAEGPNCGFLIRIPAQHVRSIETFRFLVQTSGDTQEFDAVISFVAI